jgi:hypothetical protein
LFYSVFPERDDGELVVLFGNYDITLDISDLYDPFLDCNDWPLLIPRIDRLEFDLLSQKGKSYDLVEVLERL